MHAYQVNIQKAISTATRSNIQGESTCPKKTQQTKTPRLYTNRTVCIDLHQESCKEGALEGSAGSARAHHVMTSILERIFEVTDLIIISATA